MLGWKKFQSPLLRKLNYPAFVSALLAILLLGAAFVPPATSLRQEKVPPSQVESQTEIPWSIHLHAIPASPPTGRGLFAFAGKTPDICRNAKGEEGKVTFLAELLGVPTAFDGIYDSDDSNYSGFLDNLFDSGTHTQVGELKVGCFLPNGDILGTSEIVFWRFHYTGTLTAIPSEDNNAILTLFPTSLDNPHYVIVMDTNGLPDKLPAEVQPISPPYSFRASGGATESDGPMSLELYFSDTILGEADPLTLRIFEWDAATDTWVDPGNQALLTLQGTRINKPTTKFTTYILGSTPQWCDTFETNLGLETSSMVKRVGGRLKLEDSALSGTATSTPYTPTMRIRAWQTVSYTTEITAGTSLTVSVLSLDNEVLKVDVLPGHSLSDIDPELHPSLRLQVEMSTASPGTSPELLVWCLVAEPAIYVVFLPVVIKD
jgi:hypothetical protein